MAVALHSAGPLARELHLKHAASSYRIMTDSSGKRFKCYLPSARPGGSSRQQQQQHLEHAGAATVAAAAAAQGSSAVAQRHPGGSQQQHGDASGSAAGPSKTPFELLDSLTALCLYRQEGLWTYEMCYKKHARQFRQDGKAAEDFSCGQYTGDEAQSEEIKFDASSSSMPMRYVSHNMTGGSACIMTGAKRSAEVRFTCMREARDNMIVSVKEFPTCNYVYTIATPFLCKHPAFKPPPEELHTINCVPEAEERATASTAAGARKAAGNGAAVSGGSGEAAGAAADGSGAKAVAEAGPQSTGTCDAAATAGDGQSGTCSAAPEGGAEEGADAITDVAADGVGDGNGDADEDDVGGEQEEGAGASGG